MRFWGDFVRDFQISNKGKRFYFLAFYMNDASVNLEPSCGNHASCSNRHRTVVFEEFWADDEIDKSDPNKNPEQGQPQASASGLDPASILEQSAVKDLGCASFTDFKESLRKFWAKEAYRNEEAGKWECYEDIPAKEARILLKIIKSS